MNVNLEHVFLHFVALVSIGSYLVGKCHLAQFYLRYHSTVGLIVLLAEEEVSAIPLKLALMADDAF